MKRTTFLLLLVIAATTPMNADRASGSCGLNANWIYFQELGEELDIYGFGAMDNFDLQVSYMRPPWRSLVPSIQSIVIDDGITTIGDYAFCDCWNLKSVVIPNSVTSIGMSSFKDCLSLSSITIGDGVTSIGEDAFSFCPLTSITIPKSVMSIGKHAFDGNCFTSISVKQGNTIYDSRANCNAIIETEMNMLILGCDNTTIPNSVTSIGDYAFFGCRGLTSITIPNSVTSIGEYVFYNCLGLTSITIPNSVTSIVEGAFYNCSGLTSATISESITNIGNFAFIGCGLTSIVIPKSVMKIGHSVYGQCKHLASILVETGNVNYDSRDNCNGIIETATNMLIQGCRTTIVPCSVTKIGYRAFWGCDSLTSISIPNSVINIEEEAFLSCNNLKTISLGEGVTFIGNYAFEACISLHRIICHATEVPVINSSVFNGVNTDCNLYVPSPSVEKYKADPYWGVFNVLPIDDSVTTDIDNIEESNLHGDALSGNDIMGADSSCKVFHDGKVYILRGGKTYTLTGEEVK